MTTQVHETLHSIERLGDGDKHEFYTLVQSARRNCVDVWPYLIDVLRRIAAIALATRLPWKPCCPIARWQPIQSTGWSSGKRNPARPRLAVAGNGLLVGSPSRDR
jgi:hypothetical protein